MIANIIRDESHDGEESSCVHDVPLPMARTHGLHLPDPGRVLMALDVQLYPAFYDGSGKEDTQSISLAGAAHFEQAWADFDFDWMTMLGRHGAKCFHMCDAIALQKEFSPSKGWDAIKVDRLIRDLVKVMGGHSNRGLQFRACTIIRKDYDQAKREYPTLRPLPAICANFGVGGLELPNGHSTILYFDRDEPFMHEIYRVWVHLKGKRQIRPRWVEQTFNILAVDSGYPSIQAVDFIAWSLNREHTTGDYEQWTLAAKLLCMPNWKLYDYDAIVSDYANDKWS
jgi:hypothetical protein